MLIFTIGITSQKSRKYGIIIVNSSSRATSNQSFVSGISYGVYLEILKYHISRSCEVFHWQDNYLEGEKESHWNKIRNLILFTGIIVSFFFSRNWTLSDNTSDIKTTFARKQLTGETYLIIWSPSFFNEVGLEDSRIYQPLLGHLISKSDFVLLNLSLSKITAEFILWAIGKYCLICTWDYE